MSDTSQSQLVEEIAHDLVGQVAPHELPLFRATSAAYFRRSARSLKTQGARDEMLGFGTDTAVTFLTPIVLAITNEVVEFVAASVKTSIAIDSGNLAVEQVKHMFRKYQPSHSAAQQMPLLTSAQIAQARQLAFQKARQLNLAEAQAGALADALADSMGSATP